MFGNMLVPDKDERLTPSKKARQNPNNRDKDGRTINKNRKRTSDKLNKSNPVLLMSIHQSSFEKIEEVVDEEEKDKSEEIVVDLNKKVLREC